MSNAEISDEARESWNAYLQRMEVENLAPCDHAARLDERLKLINDAIGPGLDPMQVSRANVDR